MKNLLPTLLFAILMYSCSATPAATKEIKYFDEDDNQITKTKFDEIRATHKFLDVPGDSMNHKKLIFRVNRGNISSRPALQSLIEKAINEKLDDSKPLVIIFHPGEDECNSSRLTGQTFLRNRFRELEDGVNKIAQTKPIYVYKNDTGLRKYKGIVNWHKDPAGTIERLFFQNHYPCSSFVVISKEGHFISYFGEFYKTQVFQAIQNVANEECFQSENTLAN
ncbi:hypothetical protein [Kaistella polysaccharea]|uniref:hypothetical protein n=1 Tax=Kaistella polysaccharea TaxID=2878534 RepID=UPI001CF3A42C|nr:hypothetical protein [Kaistella polysaccharea]